MVVTIVLGRTCIHVCRGTFSQTLQSSQKQKDKPAARSAALPTAPNLALAGEFQVNAGLCSLKLSSRAREKTFLGGHVSSVRFKKIPIMQWVRVKSWGSDDPGGIGGPGAPGTGSTGVHCAISSYRSSETPVIRSLIINGDQLRVNLNLRCRIRAPGPTRSRPGSNRTVWPVLSLATFGCGIEPVARAVPRQYKPTRCKRRNK